MSQKYKGVTLMASKPTRQSIKVLEPRIHIKEFLCGFPEWSTVQKAGFKAFANKEWMRPEEWQGLLKEYTKEK